MISQCTFPNKVDNRIFDGSLILESEAYVSSTLETVALWTYYLHAIFTVMEPILASPIYQKQSTERMMDPLFNYIQNYGANFIME